MGSPWVLNDGIYSQLCDILILGIFHMISFHFPLNHWDLSRHLGGKFSHYKIRDLSWDGSIAIVAYGFIYSYPHSRDQ